MNDAAVAEAAEATPESVETPTEEVAEAVEGEEQAKSGESEPSESSTEKKQDNLQERIDKLVAQRREAQEQAEYWKRQASTPQEESEYTPGKTLADFDYDESAYSKYLISETERAAEEKVRTSLERDRQARQAAQFSAREREFADSIDDYDRVTRNPTLRINEAMIDVIEQSDQGPAVLYYLGKNPDIASKLAELPPMAMALQLGQIQATELRKPEKSTTNAPAPPPRLDATEPANTVNPSSAAGDKLSMKEWVNRRNKQLSSNG